MARYTILLAFVAREGFPADTLVVNRADALLLGLTLEWFDTPRDERAPKWLRPFFAGVLGAFTTLSLIVVDHAIRIARGRNLEALAFAVVTSVGTISIALVDLSGRRRIGEHRSSKPQ